MGAGFREATLGSRPRQPRVDRPESTPFWEKHGASEPAEDGPDPVCRDVVHTGLNVRSSDAD